MNRVFLSAIIVTILVSVCFAGDRESGPDTPSVRGRIIPTMASLESGEQHSFRIVINASRHDYAYVPDQVQWAVNGIIGGNERVGTITSGGVYTAPEIRPDIHEIIVSGYVEGVDNSTMNATVLLHGVHPEYEKTGDFVLDLEQPTDITVEQDGNYLITSKNIHRYTPDGERITSLGKIGLAGDLVIETETTEDEIVNPFNIAVDKEGKIFVSDDKNVRPRIMAFEPNGSFLYSFSDKGYLPGMTYRTRGMAFDSENRLYIGDVELSHIHVFDNSGAFLFRFGEEGHGTTEFNGLRDLALDMNGDIFVANYYGACQKRDAYGRYRFSFAESDPPDGLIYRSSLTTDHWGNVYVAVHGPKRDGGAYRIARDTNGEPVHIVKYNNFGDRVASIRLARDTRQPIRIKTDNEGRLLILYQDGDEFGVEIYAQIR